MLQLDDDRSFLGFSLEAGVAEDVGGLCVVEHPLNAFRFVVGLYGRRGGAGGRWIEDRIDGDAGEQVVRCRMMGYAGGPNQGCQKHERAGKGAGDWSTAKPGRGTVLAGELRRL